MSGSKIHKYVIFGAFVTAAAGLLVGYGSKGRPQDTASKVAATSNELDVLRGELARLRSDQKAVAQNVAVALQGAVKGQKEPISETVSELKQDTVSEVDVDPEVSAQRRDELRKAEITHIGEVFAHQQTDPTWAPIAVRAIEQAYSRPELSSLKLSARCAQTLCRVDFKYDSRNGGAHETMGMLMSRPPWQQAGGVVNVDENGNGTQFITREGYNLPVNDSRTN